MKKYYLKKKRFVFIGCLTPFFASATCVAVFQGCVGFPTIFLSQASKSRQILLEHSIFH